MYYVFKRWASENGVVFEQVSVGLDTEKEARSFIKIMKKGYKHKNDHLVILQEVRKYEI